MGFSQLSEKIPKGQPVSQESGDVGRSGDGRTNRRLEKLRPQIQAWEDFCAKRDEPSRHRTGLAPAQPRHHGTIIGPRTLAQLDGSQHALDIQLDTNAMNELDQMFPGPGGTAPEAYA